MGAVTIERASDTKVQYKDRPQALVVYDSAYGNTAKVAQAIAEALADGVVVTTVLADRLDPGVVQAADLLVVGSPTQGGRPTATLARKLSAIPAHSLDHTAVAAFDTRLAEAKQRFGLRMLMKTIGFAAAKIAHSLRTKGGQLLVQPEGFIVKGQAGPLETGELDRARNWGQTIGQLVRV